MCSSDAPDTSKQQEAALQMSQLSKEELEWAKQIYAETAPDRANATARANEVSNAQLTALNKQTDLTDDYAAYQKNTFRPLEEGIVADAQAYDTPARREAEAAKATAGVEMSLANQRAASNRELERSGVMPGSGKQLALSGAMDLGSAKLKAGAASQARSLVETVGAARRSDAANLGRNLASNQATSASLALNQGNASAANAASTGGIAAQGAALMNSGYSGAQSGLSNAASTYGQIANTQANAASGSSGLFGALGSVAGQYAGSAAGSAQLAAMFSDKNMKKDRKPVSGKLSLAALRKVPVESWKYKKDSPGDDGGKAHVGPMAQAYNKALGDATAPDGTKVDLISLSGHQTGAIKELDKRLIKLEKTRSNR